MFCSSRINHLTWAAPNMPFRSVSAGTTEARIGKVKRGAWKRQCPLIWSYGATSVWQGMDMLVYCILLCVSFLVDLEGQWVNVWLHYANGDCSGNASSSWTRQFQFRAKALLWDDSWTDFPIVPGQVWTRATWFFLIFRVQMLSYKKHFLCITYTRFRIVTQRQNYKSDGSWFWISPSLRTHWIPWSGLSNFF